MQDAHVDLSHFGISVLDRPVVSACTALLETYSLFDQGTEAEALVEQLIDTFVRGEDWCAVGDDLYRVSAGCAEVRLRALPDGSGWHADLFDAAWGRFSVFENVPDDYRPVVVAYVERVQDLPVSALCLADLRAAAANGGAQAVDQLVRRNVAMLDRSFEALDALHAGLHTPEGSLPGWARAVVQHHAVDWLFRREWLTSAVVGYHHGSAGHRPETIWGGITIPFTKGMMDIVAEVDADA